MTEFDRENPLFERTCVPFEIVGRSKTNGYYTVRIIEGYRPLRNGNARERVFRFEMSDECNLVKTTHDFDRGAQGCHTPLNGGRSGPTHFHRTPKIPMIHAPFMTANRGKDPMLEQSRSYRSERDSDRAIHHAVTNRSIELYELEVGESDFDELRRDQALLVDFDNFATSLISLMQCCWLGNDGDSSCTISTQSSNNATLNQYSRQNNASQFGGCDPSTLRDQAETRWSKSHWNPCNDMRTPSPHGRPPVSTYTCRLETLSSPSDDNSHWEPGNVSTGYARFSVVESNQFRELTHLALNLNIGTDKSIRLYLSSRLSQVMVQTINITNELGTQKQRCEAAERNFIEANRRLGEMSQTYETEKYQLQCTAQERIENEHNCRLAQISEVTASKDSQIQALNEDLQRSQLTFESKIRALEDANKKIIEDKSSCQHENETLVTRLNQQETSNKLMTTEIIALKGQLERIAADKSATEKSLRDLQVLLASLENSNTDHKYTLSQTAEQMASTEKVYADAKQTIKQQHHQIDDLHRRLTESESESAKYKELASRYQVNRVEMKKRIKEKVETIREQEEIIRSREKEAEEFKRQVQGLEDDLRRAQDEKHCAIKELVSATAMMDENAKKLENNQQVIAWLNKQVDKNTSSGVVWHGNTPKPPLSRYDPKTAPSSHPAISSSLSRYLPKSSFATTPYKECFTVTPSIESASLAGRLHPEPHPL
ncbi:hypothetical protein HJC23_002995 [Cyclotella cryptica]|uniref:Spindle assembly abnormal protein 6 N-terminal domain-containing protein n=1 Tax=Cyclotella cryptica TaxID=29204 RepID=A0ABD3PTC1_9STRA